MIARPMTQSLSLEEARAVLGKDILGPEEVAAAFGPLSAAERDIPVPHKRAELEAARRAGEMLVLRVARAADHRAITIAHMIQTFPEAFDQKLLRQAGYQLKNDWGIELEPLAREETCQTGWALVRKEILDSTRNLAYDEQSACLAQYAATLGVPAESVRRRTAAEATYDTVLAFAARGERLLEKTWDWTSSETVDRGYLNVGGFGAQGMQLLSFSGAVRHGALGICPTRALG
jgi:hypothetical protein